MNSETAPSNWFVVTEQKMAALTLECLQSATFVCSANEDQEEHTNLKDDALFVVAVLVVFVVIAQPLLFKRGTH